jgi:NADPH:quinone reductase-like Zn-dependent oxidoreductase
MRSQAADGDHPGGIGIVRAVIFHEYGDPSVLRIEDRPRPMPTGDQVLVRVAGSSLNPADVGSRGGQMRLVHARHMPHVPGNDVSGVVEACGPRVTAFVPGERVYALVGLAGGAQAEYAVVAQSKLARAPASIPLVQAAAVPLAGLTALQALRGRARIQSPRRVLINGAAGGVGTLAVQIARAMGCHVTATCRGAKCAQVLALGADEVIDYSREDFTRRAERWDVVLDAAIVKRFDEVLPVLAPDGVLVSPRPTREAIVHVALKRIRRGPRAEMLITRASGHDLALLTAMIDRGELRPLVHRVYPMDEIQAAHREFESGRFAGKIVIQVGAEPAGARPLA